MTDMNELKTKYQVGKDGEDKACEYLVQNSYNIIERNFRCRSGEIDIIANKDDLILFVEVKTRQGISYGFPAEAVNEKKRHRLILSARYFLAGRSRYANYKYRMDVIEVFVKGSSFCIHHIENAFGEGGI